MSSPYPVLGDRPIDQWKVTELKDELKRRKLITKGLKDDLIKRLDEAIRNEQESLNEDNGFGSVPQSEALPVHERAEVPTSEKAQDSLSIRDTVNEEINLDLHPQVTYEQESGNLFVSEGAEHAISHGDSTSEKVDRNMLDVDINDSHGSVEEEQVREVKGVDGSDATGLGGNQVDRVIAEKTNELVAENLEPVIALKEEDSLDIGTQSESSDGKAQLEDHNSKSLHGDAKDNLSDTNNQVSEVNPVLGFQVNESYSTETVSIIEKNELKDNIIANDVKLELDVKPEMMQPSSSSDVPEDGKPHSVDVEEPHANMVSVEETGGSSAEIVDVAPKNDTGDLSSSGKVNLDQSSGDDFMDEDATETKLMGPKTDSEETRTNSEKVETSALKDEGGVDIVGEDITAEKTVSNTEEKNHSAIPSVKRKLNEQLAVGNTDVAKRQRRWNSEGLKVPEAQTDDVSTTPKNVFQPAFKRSFSRSDSSVSEEVLKERVVPPPANPPTTSLRIDRFLRPFTLKAVQELLGKTGTVTSFWMDHIKTHCYVSYSSVEEAVETRNAVYNLQWPPNGGRLLVAEFADPQEVKARVEASPQSPATPVGSGASVLPVTQNAQPQPSPRPQVPRQQLPQPPPPPPPTLSNPPLVREQVPPPAREHHLPPIRERLTLPPPPPPPLAEKAEAPIVTLDDLFRKTKATPRIYYLPLSDAQVAAKLQGQGKTVKQ